MQYNNVEYQKLIEGLKEKNNMLTLRNEDLKALAVAAAESKRKYAQSFAKSILKLKSDGHPATLIRELAQGGEELSKLRFQKDVDGSLYDACKESIRNLRLQIESYRSLLSAEKEERFNPNA